MAAPHRTDSCEKAVELTYEIIETSLPPDKTAGTHMLFSVREHSPRFRAIMSANMPIAAHTRCATHHERESMNQADLASFYEVAICKGIRKAYERLGIAPSALSKHVSRLEADLGIKLLDRSSRGMILTPAGEICMHYAEDVLQGQKRVVSELEALKGLRNGHVKLHSTEGQIDFVTESVASFQHRYPGVTFEIEVASTESTLIAVASGDTDIGLAFTPAPNDTLECALRIAAPLEAVVAPSHALASRKSVTLKELLTHPTVLPASDFGIRRMIDSICVAERLRLAPSVVTNSISAMKSFVRSQGGATILSHMSIHHELESGLLVSVPLSHPLLSKSCIDVCVLGRRRLPQAVSAYLRHLRKQVKGTEIESQPG